MFKISLFYSDCNGYYGKIKDLSRCCGLSCGEKPENPEKTHQSDLVTKYNPTCTRRESNPRCIGDRPGL